MALWTGNNNIPDDTLFEDFPEQCFPDVDAPKVSISRNAILICCEDSDWALQSDISLAVGPGCMHFFFSGALRIEMEGPQGKKVWSLAEAAKTPPPPIEDIRLIRRGTPWEFSFTGRDNTIIVFYADITDISWKSEGDF